MAHEARDDDVLVQATRKEFWQFIVHSGQVTQHHYKHTKADLKHIAFYRTSPVSAITHYARVIDKGRIAHPRETFRDERDLMNRAEKEKRSWLDRCHVVYKIGPLIALRHPVRKSSDERPILSRKWTTLGQLLGARMLKDL